MADLLESYVHTERLGTWNRHRGHVGMDGKRKPGGEWDYLRYHVTLRNRRRLAGAGWLVRGGLAPDQLELVLHAAGLHHDNPIEWYVKTALAAIPEARLASEQRRRNLLAHREGHESFYAYRNARAVSLGYRSLYDQRRQEGWQ